MREREIRLKIHEEADLFSDYDPDQKLLAEDVAQYLEHNYVNKHRSAIEQYTVRIYSDTPVNEQSVAERFREYFIREKDNVSYTIKKLTLKQVFMTVLGFAILSVWYFLSVNSETVGAVRLEILSIIGGLAVWEGANIALLERPELVKLKKAYDRIINARIVVDVK